jgi:hypothetical protein
MNNVHIHFTKKFSDLDENQVASVNQLLQLFREKITTIPSIQFNRCLSNIHFLPGVDDKMKIIDCYETKESDIPILIQFFASPRADGQQRVMTMHFWSEQFPVAQKLLDAIKEVCQNPYGHMCFFLNLLQDFRTSTQPLPQPFFLKFRAYENIPQSEEENPQTDETLTVMPNRNRRKDFLWKNNQLKIKSRQ